MPIGLSLPFAKSTGSLGYLSSTDTELQAVQADILSLLLTDWGERPMQYYFGCNMSEFVFEQKTDDLKQQIASRIISQVGKWLPFIKLDELNILYGSDDGSIGENSLKVKMRFSFASRTDLRGTLEHTF